MTKNSKDNQINDIETIEQAQTDMCKSYANGSIGIIVSGTIWLISAIIVAQLSPKHGIWSLLIGGMLISPLSIILGKFLGLSGTHTKGNPLANLAMESTILMIMCIPLAVGLSLEHTAWFFQGMLMIIGGRYLTFSTIYGKKQYWVLGAILGIASFLLFKYNAQAFTSAISGSVIEIIFGIFMFISFRKAGEIKEVN
jgi:hypothetical protein